MTPKAPKAIGWDKLGPGSPLTTALRSKQQHTHVFFLQQLFFFLNSFTQLQAISNFFRLPSSTTKLDGKIRRCIAVVIVIEDKNRESSMKK